MDKHSFFMPTTNNCQPIESRSFVVAGLLF